MKNKGKLYLLPTPLGDGGLATIPQYAIDILHHLDYFIAERAKTARRFIKTTNPVKSFDQLHFAELNKRTTPEEINQMLSPALAGHDMGLMSEAGCPAVADPGSKIVQLAHQQGVEVVPIVGPSSILLALMASGMNGQLFTFHGYLSPKKQDLSKDLKRLEQQIGKQRQTQIFIETPYRNEQMIETAIKTLRPTTRLCMAMDLTLSSETILSATIGEWQKMSLPSVHKKPAIFLIG